MKKSRLDVYSYASYQKLLADELLERRRLKPSYSSRAFARDLKLSISMLSKTLNYKKGLSVESATKIAVNLDYSSKEQAYFRALVTSHNEPNEKLKLEALSYIFKHGHFIHRTAVANDKLELLSRWYSIIIFSALDLEKYCKSPGLLVDVLEISAEQLEDAINNLEKLKFIRRENKQIEKIVDSIEFGENNPNAAVRGYHMSQMIKAQEMLLHSPIDRRYFKNICFTYDDKYRLEISQKIDRFIEDLCSYQKLGESNSLASVNINALFFPDEES